MAQGFKSEILEVRDPAPHHFELILSSENMSQALPGQFCQVLTPGTLRRPLSFSRIDGERHRVGLLFRVVGPGTAWLSQRGRGQCLDVMGPLGRGFSPPAPNAPWILVGGGVGIPPLYTALERWGGADHLPTVLLGARRQDDLVMRRDFEEWGIRPILTTDDGSAGISGNVVGPLREWMAEYPEGHILACGPTPMLAAISQVTEFFAGVVQVALEQRMGCGIGACLACVVPTQPIGSPGPRYRRVCTDGPVFRREELVF